MGSTPIFSAMFNQTDVRVWSRAIIHVAAALTIAMGCAAVLAMVASAVTAAVLVTVYYVNLP